MKIKKNKEIMSVSFPYPQGHTTTLNVVAVGRTTQLQHLINSDLSEITHLILDIARLKTNEPNAELIAFIQSLSRLDSVSFKNPNLLNEGQTPLHLVCKRNLTELVSIVIKNGFDPNAQDKMGNTPLHEALETDNLETINALLKAGANPNAENPEKLTPLLIAIHKQAIETIKTLVKAGADINHAYGIYKIAPLHVAVGKNLIEITQFLLQAGANPKIENSFKKTPLHIAAECCRLGNTKLLLQADGIAINAQDRQGNTPLHYIVSSTCLKGIKKGSIEIIQELLDAGADLFIRNGEGQTPLEYGQQPPNRSAQNINQDALKTIQELFNAAETFRANKPNA